MEGYEAIGCTAILIAATDASEAIRTAPVEAATPRVQLPYKAGETESRGAVAGLSLVAIVAVNDVLKPDAANVVAALQKTKVDVWIASGDNERTAQYVGALANIPPDHVVAGVKPEGKKKKIEELQAAGHVVAMVGDGINDAPALAQANVGIAVGSGTDVAFETADMVLMRPHLHSVITAIDLARATLRRIKINFVWAFIYNVVGIPFAAGVFYPTFKLHLPPMFAGIAMVSSSISVVLSSLMLNLYRPPLVVRRAERALDKAAKADAKAKAKAAAASEAAFAEVATVSATTTV